MSVGFNTGLFGNLLYQKTNYKNDSTANATAFAYATADSATASAFASASSSMNNIFNGGYEQMNCAIDNKESEQNNKIMQMLQLFMQMLKQVCGKTQNVSGQSAFMSPELLCNSNASSSALDCKKPNHNLLNKVSQKERDAVKGEDLGAVDKNGHPKYLIAKAKDGQFHIYKQADNAKGRKGQTYRCVSQVKQGSNFLHVKNSSENKAAAAAADGKLIQDQGSGKTGSPLILDTNKDGKVSAEQGKGVDIDGDGKADGAATGGDKMLAMGDIDGDGEITGKEVFGDKTVDPFTGKNLNAKNGFEALKKVAQSAEKHTGIKCIDENGKVDLQKLKQAMEQSGKGSLGMISGNNNTKLEGLGDVSKINTSNYINKNDSGDVQHNQIGTYQTLSGEQQRVDDVWFKLS